MRLSFLTLLLLICFTGKSQVAPIFYQDFDTIMTPAWNFTGNGLTFINGNSSANDLPANSPFGIGGSWAWETTAQTTPDTMTFDNVLLSGYDSVYITFRVAAFALNLPSDGVDQLDYVMVKISVDGGTTWYNRVRLSGAQSNNSYWPYTSTGVGLDTFSTVTATKTYRPAASGLATADGYSTIRVNIPSNYTQVRLQILSRESTVNERWCIDNVAIMGVLVVPQAPAAAFQPSQDTICPGSCVSFTDQSQHGPTSWAWSFPGAAIPNSTQQHPAGICYMTPGNYSVTLIAGNANGSDTISQTIHVGYPDTSVTISGNLFSANTNGATYQWYNCSTSSNVPGATNQTFSPSITGDYAVIVSANGCSDTSSCYSYVQPALPPVANFSASQTNICAGTCISFTDSSTQSPSSWAWDFPGASTTSSTAQHPTGICYNTGGSFTATLIATNAAGSDTFSIPITVTSVDTSVSVSGSMLTANANGAQYQWYDCGAGQILPNDTLQSFTPTLAGSYSVIVTTGACTDTSSCYQISIAGQPPVAGFQASQTMICPGSCITFTDQTFNNPTSWQWNFPGANPDTSSSPTPPSICYAAPGTYTAELIATNGSGSDTSSIQITVAAPDSSWDTASVCIGSVFTFPDGDTSSVAGSHQSILTNAMGCDSIVETLLNILPHTADTTLDTFAICLGQVHTFHDGTTSSVAGNHISVLQNSNGCDSLVQTTLQLRTVNTNVLQSGSSLTSLAANSVYQWVNCPGYSPVNGATAQQFIAAQSGSYAVIVTQNSCSDTSNCYQVVINGMKDEGANAASIYPVPFRSELVVKSTHTAELNSAILLDIEGREILFAEKQSVDEAVFRTSELPSGIYFVRIYFQDGRTLFRKVVKN